MKIERLAWGGDGVARPAADEPVVFVPRTAVGDVAEVEVTEEKPRFRRARVVTLVEEGAARTAPPCPFYAGKDDAHSCGGCQYQHLGYDAQIAAKVEQLRESLRRIGGIAEPKVGEAIAAPRALGYRNKGTFHWDAAAGVFGLVAVDGRSVLPVSHCPLLVPSADALYRAAAEVARALAAGNAAFREGALSLVVRASEATGETLVGLVTRPDTDEAIAREFAARVREAVATGNVAPTAIAWGRSRRPAEPMREVRWTTLAGARTIRERIGGLTFLLDAETFFQVNTAQAERLYATAMDAAQLSGREIVVDVYCGNGGIALTAAAKAKQVVGVEVVRAAIERGIDSAKANGIRNVRFEPGAAEDVIKKLIHARHLKADVVFVDPPRAGLKSGVPKLLAKLGPRRIVYVSCDPATLARDLKALRAAGYELRHVTPVDLFPQTYHLEAVALLEAR